MTAHCGHLLALHLLSSANTNTTMTSRRILVLTVLTLLAAEPARGVEIVLRATSTPQGHIVRLGDIAEIRKASPQRADQMS